MVMRFRGGELLHVARVVRERASVEQLEMGGGHARQRLDGLEARLTLRLG